MTAPAGTTDLPVYTHLASVGRWTNVPVRRDGRHWVSRAQVHLAVYHAPRNVYDVRPMPAGPPPPMAHNGRRHYQP